MRSADEAPFHLHGSIRKPTCATSSLLSPETSVNGGAFTARLRPLAEDGGHMFSQAEPLWRNPTIGMARCYAPATSGRQAAAADDA